MPGTGEDKDPDRLTDEHATSATMRAAGVTGSWLEEDTRAGLAEEREDVSGAHDRRALADRLSAVETLAAGLAHEINNPLTYTLINVESMLRRMRVLAAAPPTPAVADEMTAALPSFVESLDQTLHGLRRVRQVVLVADDRSHAAGSARRSPVRRTGSSSSRRRCRWRSTRSCTGARPPSAICERSAAHHGESSALGHVFLGLIVNAAQAIPLGDARDNEVRVSTRLDDDGLVVIEVSDTGAGIAPDVLPRIFDPFFTSSGSRQGVGPRPLGCLRDGAALRGRHQGVERPRRRNDLSRRASAGQGLARARGGPAGRGGRRRATAGHRGRRREDGRARAWPGRCATSPM